MRLWLGLFFRSIKYVLLQPLSTAAHFLASTPIDEMMKIGLLGTFQKASDRFRKQMSH